MYKFDPAAGSVESAFRAIALSQIDAALADHGDSDGERRTLVHEARRRCKKLRGLLRLVRPAFADFAIENAAIRDASALLSHLRDAEVLRQTLADLARRGDNPALLGMSERLSHAPAAAPDPQRLVAFRDGLRPIRERAERWSLTKSGHKAVIDGLHDVYRAARQRMAVAGRTGKAADFHEWRKAAKYHGFHLDLLKKLAPELLAGDLKAVDALSDLLGQHHDLTMLGNAATRSPEQFGDAADVAALLDAIAARQPDIQAEADALGRQIFAERPRALAARFTRYWSSAPQARPGAVGSRA